MDKNSLLQEIRNLSSKKEITKQELTDAFDEGSIALTNPGISLKHLSISEIMYYLGGSIVFIGISVLIWQNWTHLSSFTKVLATLGSGLLAYIIGVLLSRNPKYLGPSNAFHLISALVLPLGFYILFDSFGYKIDNGAGSIIYAALTLIQLISYFIFKKPLFVIFGTIYATLLFFIFTNWITEKDPFFASAKFIFYRFLMVGGVYILLGYYFAKSQLESLSDALYSFGALFVLAFTLALSGWKPNQSFIWEILHPLLVFSSIFASVYIKNRSFLTLGTAFLMIYILKITSEYFSQSLGWPLTLVLAGFGLIGVGIFSLNLGKKLET